MPPNYSKNDFESVKSELVWKLENWNGGRLDRLQVGVMVMVPRAVYEVLGYWPLGVLLCHLHTALDVTCCTSSILHLCAVSLDRYYAIVKDRAHTYSTH